MNDLNPFVLCLAVLARVLAPVTVRLGEAGMLDERGVFRVPHGMSEHEATRRLARALDGRIGGYAAGLGLRGLPGGDHLTPVREGE